MTKRKTYNTNTATTENTIVDTTLIYTKMLMVCREGVNYDIYFSNLYHPLSSRQVRFAVSTGTIAFSELIPFNDNETIDIVYETNP